MKSESLPYSNQLQAAFKARDEKEFVRILSWLQFGLHLSQDEVREFARESCGDLIEAAKRAEPTSLS